MRSFFQQQPGFCLRLLRDLTAFFFSFRAKSQLYNHINSGCTPYDVDCWLLTVDCWLLTVDCWLLTVDCESNNWKLRWDRWRLVKTLHELPYILSFRCSRKRYQSSRHSNSHQPVFFTLIEGLNEERGLKNPVAPSRTNIVYGCFGMI